MTGLFIAYKGTRLEDLGLVAIFLLLRDSIEGELSNGESSRGISSRGRGRKEMSILSHLLSRIFPSGNSLPQQLSIPQPMSLSVDKSIRLESFANLSHHLFRNFCEILSTDFRKVQSM